MYEIPTLPDSITHVSFNIKRTLVRYSNITLKYISFRPSMNLCNRQVMQSRQMILSGEKKTTTHTLIQFFNLIDHRCIDYPYQFPINKAIISGLIYEGPEQRSCGTRNTQARYNTAIVSPCPIKTIALCVTVCG